LSGEGRGKRGGEKKLRPQEKKAEGSKKLKELRKEVVDRKGHPDHAAEKDPRVESQ